MTVGAAQIKAAEAKGLTNVAALAAACDKLKFPFYLACVICEKETRGRNIFGHDAGGVFYVKPPATVEVTEARYKEFLQKIGDGHTSNGVGPMQLTFKGYHIGPLSLAARGLKGWVPADNMLYGVEILANDLKRYQAQGMSLEKAFWQTARNYNNSDAYADDAVARARTWAATVGSSDMEVPVATERIPFRGAGLTCIDLIRILPLVEYRFMLKGWIKQDFSGLIFQLTYGHNVPASFNTHKTGAVLDVTYGMVDSDDKLRTWRECGVIMEPRPTGTIRNVKPHGHGCVAGCPHLSPEAQAQVDDYRTHFGNGLLNDQPALGPHVPYITYQNALKKYAALVEDMNMPTAKEIVDEMVRQAPALGKGFAQGFLNADDIITAGHTEPDPKNKAWAAKTFVTNDFNALDDLRDQAKAIRAVLEKLAAAPPTPPSEPPPA